MKKILIISFAMIILFISEISAKPRPDVSFNFFYSSLRPYGEWIEIDADVVAWRPYNVHSSWRPYTMGQWSWTENGWYWDSDEPFGWATYHYGRWYNDDYYGWIWIPDYDWGPAWVEWRYNDDYIGWAPLPPYASFSIHLGINFSIGWNAGYNWWNFVSYNRFCHPHVHHYMMDHRRISRIFGSTKYRNHYYYDRDRIVNGGLDRSFIERRGGYRIKEREIRSLDNRNDYERSRGRDGERVYSYRPSERELTRSNSDDRFEIKRGDKTSTIERDKLSTPRFTERNPNRESPGTIERNSGDRTIRNSERERREVIRDRGENTNREVERSRDAERNSDEKIRRSIERESIRKEMRGSERPQVERRAEPERRVEIKREQSSERSNARMERNNDRSERKSESRNENRSERESRGSAERRR